MKKMFFSIATVATIVMTGCKFDGAGSADYNTPKELNSEKAKFSYSVGFKLGEQIADMKDEFDIDVLFSSIVEGMNGESPRLAVEEAMDVQRTVFTRLQEEDAKKREARSADGVAFLEANKTQEGVITTESGLQYRVVKAGESDVKPTKSDVVTVHYTGKLIDGKVFDSSVDRGQPATFPVSGVIPGWTEALKLMTVGSKYELFIPSNLAYGPRGTQGGPIGPNETLIFEVELLEIKDQN